MIIPLDPHIGLARASQYGSADAPILYAQLRTLFEITGNYVG